MANKKYTSVQGSKLVKNKYNNELKEVFTKNTKVYDIEETKNILHGIDLSIFKQATKPLKCTVENMVNISSSTTHQAYNANRKQNQLPVFLSKMWNQYLSKGCGWWENRVNLWTDRLGRLNQNPNSTQELINLEVYNSEINFAKAMQNTCGCAKVQTSEPEGYSYTEKGTLLKTETIEVLEKQKDKKVEKLILNKTIKKLDINIDDILPNGEIRSFKIIGDSGAMFWMEVYDADGNYYNFSTQAWSSTKYQLKTSVIRFGSYSGKINFSNIASKTHVYTILLYAEDGNFVKTKHDNYVERKKTDNSIDENNSQGSNSKLIKRTITQQQGVSLTLSAIAPKSGDSITDTVDGAVGSGTNIVMDTSYLTKKIIIGDKVSGTNVAAGTTIAAVNVASTNDRYTLSTAVGGTVADAATLTFAGPFNTMTPDHDTTTGSAVISNLSTGYNTVKKSFTITLTAPSGRAFTILRQPKEEDLTSISLVTFGSAALALEGEDTTSSSLFYRWPVDNVAGLAKGMVLDPSKSKANTTIASFISDYKVTTTVTTEGSEEVRTSKGPSPAYSEESVTTETSTTKFFTKGVESTGLITAVNRQNKATAQAGNIIFNNQQVDALKSDTDVKIFGYGLNNIKTMSFGAELKFTNLAATLSEITTATSSAVSNSTSIPVDERLGILDGTSTMTGIGIVTAPKVSSAAIGSTGAGTIVVSAAQTIEDNTTLTFSGASNVITITGNVEVLNMPESNVIIYFDVEKFLTCF